MNPLLEVKNLYVIFNVRTSYGKKEKLTAVENVSFELKKGEILGIVGESGCGKSSLAGAIAGLVPITSGKVIFNGIDITTVNRRKYELAKKIQIIFQDPFGSLNPRYPIGKAISEVLLVHRMFINRKEAFLKTKEFLELVGINPSFISHYPHELSGGQRQRVSIARALAINPQILIADEPVSALDISVQAHILNLLRELHEKLSLTIILIAHDLAVIRYLCNRVAVMYMGSFVEVAETEELFKNPCHPYTQLLISSVPDIENKNYNFESENIKETNPARINTGCKFYSRCKYAIPVCQKVLPEIVHITPNHLCCCLHFRKINPAEV